jgi:hypothetical protein
MSRFLKIFVLFAIVLISFPETLFAAYGDGTLRGTVEINSSTTNGPTLSDADRFGWKDVTNIGDLNGDGVIDLAAGAATDDNGGTDRGAVHIFFMNTDGSVDSTVEINDGTANGPVLSDNDYFGSAIANLGDLNGDGVQDLAIGAQGDDDGGTDRGAIHLLFMNTDGSVDSTVEINDSTANGPVLANSDSFGYSAVSLGDLDGDGVQDLAVGAAGDDGAGGDQGVVHILFMNTDGSVDSTVEINISTPNGPTNDNWSYMASSLANLGDLNGDGVVDLLIGSPGGSAGRYALGAVFITFLNTDGSVDSTVMINDNTVNGPTLHYSDYFGIGVANAGDLNGDGVTDIAVGAHIDDFLGTDRGAVYVLFMNTDGSVDSTAKIDDSTSNGPVLANADQFGHSITSLGDLNGDGVLDLAVGAHLDDEGGANRGAVHILFFQDVTPGLLGGGSSSDMQSSCTVSDSTVETGDKVTINVTIETTEDAYEFEWTKVLEGDDEDTEYTFNTAGTFYPRGQIKSNLGYDVVNCGTITVTEGDADDQEDEDGDSSSSSQGDDDVDEADDDRDENTETSPTTNLSALVSEHRNFLLSLQAAGITLPEAVLKLLAQPSSTTGSSIAFTRDLDLGATGPDVTTLQQLLIAQGYVIPAGATGYFGAQTQTALIQFQTAKGITPAAGYFGSATRAVMEEL